jgi:hypothetical protein
MSSVRRKHSLLLLCCILITLLLMSGHAATNAHARVATLWQGAAQRSMVVIDTHVTGEQCSLQQTAAADDSSSGCLLADDHDADDVWLLPPSVQMRLDYFPSVAPISADTSAYPAPVTSPLRPPSLV